MQGLGPRRPARQSPQLQLAHHTHWLINTRPSAIVTIRSQRALQCGTGSAEYQSVGHNSMLSMAPPSMQRIRALTAGPSPLPPAGPPESRASTPRAPSSLSTSYKRASPRSQRAASSTRPLSRPRLRPPSTDAEGRTVDAQTRRAAALCSAYHTIVFGFSVLCATCTRSCTQLDQQLQRSSVLRPCMAGTPGTAWSAGAAISRRGSRPRTPIWSDARAALPRLHDA